MHSNEANVATNAELQDSYCTECKLSYRQSTVKNFPFHKGERETEKEAETGTETERQGERGRQRHRKGEQCTQIFCL